MEKKSYEATIWLLRQSRKRKLNVIKKLRQDGIFWNLNLNFCDFNFANHDRKIVARCTQFSFVQTLNFNSKPLSKVLMYSEDLVSNGKAIETVTAA